MASPGNPAVAQFVESAASGLLVVLVGWITATVRRAAKKFMGEHDWLMQTTAKNSTQIAENTQAIKQMLEQERPRRR